VVRGLVYLTGPESYTRGSLAPGRVTHARQVEGRGQTKNDPLALQSRKSLLYRKQQRKEPKQLDVMGFESYWKLAQNCRQEWRTFVAALHASGYCEL